MSYLWMTLSLSRSCEPQDIPAGEPERKNADQAEGHIHQLPEPGDGPQRAQGQRPGDQEPTGDHAPLNHPAVANGVDQGAHKSNRNGDMGECQPVRAIGYLRENPVGGAQAVVDISDPMPQS